MLAHVAILPVRPPLTPENLPVVAGRPRDAGRDERRDLGVGVRKVGVLREEVAQGGAAPARAARGCGHRLSLKDALDRTQPRAVRDHLEHAPDGLHLLLFHEIGVAGLVEPESVGHSRRGDEEALPGLLAPSPARAFGNFQALSLRDPALEEPEELPLVAVVAPVVQGDQLAAAPVELLIEEHPVPGVAGDAVGVLGDD